MEPSEAILRDIQGASAAVKVTKQGQWRGEGYVH